LVGSGGVKYLWSTGDTISTIKVGPEVTTIYTLTVTNNVCTDEDVVTVNVNLNPTATASTDQEVLLEGFNMSTTIRGEGAGIGGAYDWTPPIGLSDPTNATPAASPLVSSRYFLTVTDADGCKDTSSVLIKIIESIEYPDGVSPNADGINDDWPIRYIESFPEAIVEIYNRWGQLLFHSVGYHERWNGTYEGKSLPVGTYYFVIDLGADLPKYTGPITIFR
jgi:gliding motility-associated-like protein